MELTLSLVAVLGSMSCRMSFTSCVIDGVTSPDLITKDLGTLSCTVTSVTRCVEKIDRMIDVPRSRQLLDLSNESCSFFFYVPSCMYVEQMDV